MDNNKIVIVTRPDDGWILGAFDCKEKAKKYIEDEVEHYESYECDYWKTEMNSGSSELC